IFYSFNDPATTKIYTLSLHDALPICTTRRITGSPEASDLALAHPRAREACRSDTRDPCDRGSPPCRATPLSEPRRRQWPSGRGRSEEHTSELQSPCNLVCRLLLEKKK